MNVKKLFAVVLVAAFLIGSLASLIPIARGVEVVTIYSYSIVSNYALMNSNDPSYNAYPSRIAGCFIATNSGYINGVNFYTNRWGTGTTGEIRCYLMTVTGDIAADTATPSTIIETSSTVLHIEDYSTAHTSATFVFEGRTLLTAGQQYAIVFVTSNMNHDGESGYGAACSICIIGGITTQTYSEFKNGGYVVNTGSVVAMDVMGIDVPTPTPTPEPTPTPTPPTHRLPYYLVSDYYFHASSITTNGVAGYLISEDQPIEDHFINTSTLGSVDVTYGSRIYLVQNRTTTELTNGEPQATVTIPAASGNVSVTDLSAEFYIPQTYLEFGKDALEFDVYLTFDDGDTWQPVAIFITENLFYKQIQQSVIEVHYFIDREETGSTSTNYCWGGGSNNYLSGFKNIYFKEATNPDWQQYFLNQQNFVMFVMAPYVMILGNTFYGIILLAFCAGIYIRYRNISPVVLFVILIAGTLVAGGVNIAFGEYVVGLIWAVCAFGIALVYWRVFR